MKSWSQIRRSIEIELFLFYLIEQKQADVNSLLLLLGLLCHVLPLMFRYAGVGESAAITAQATLNLSRVSCIVMLLAYFGYLVFQLWTHRQLFDAQAVSNCVWSCFIVKFKKNKVFRNDFFNNLKLKFCVSWWIQIRVVFQRKGGDYNMENRTFTNKKRVQIANQLSY